MLEQRDYILRLIAMAGDMVRRAMERVRGGQPAEALEMLEQAVQRLANTSPRLVERLTPEGLVTFLGAGGPPDPRVAASLADALDARADALDALGRAAESELARSQAAALRRSVEHESDGPAGRRGRLVACILKTTRGRGARGEGRAARAAAAFLETHCDEDVPLSRLAAEVGVSPAHLQRTFTRVFGHSPKQHQTGLRVEALKSVSAAANAWTPGFRRGSGRVAASTRQPGDASGWRPGPTEAAATG